MLFASIVSHSLLAVHIMDGVLSKPWQAGGFVGAALLIVYGMWRISDEQIPHVALLTAAFFVTSLIHVKVPPTSVHLLLNGLVGVVLGRRAAVAIPIAVFLQAVLFQHGGYTTIGVNSCLMTVPALAAWQLFAMMQRVPWVRRPWFRGILVAFCVLAWILSLVYSCILLYTNRGSQLSAVDLEWANQWTFHPLTLLVAMALAALAAWIERYLANAPEFPLGLLVGEITVLTTVLLNAVVLRWGGEEDWPALVLLTLVPHLFIAVIEGVILGFTIGFLARVKPELLRSLATEKREYCADARP